MSSTSPSPWLLTDNNYHYYHYSTGRSRDSKVLLAAVLSLVFAIALIFLLHLYIRHILRRSRHLPRSHSTTSHRISVVTSQAAQPSSPSLAPSALAAIPTFEFRKRGAGESCLTECAVCLSEVEEREVVRLLPNCRHVFHVGCIDMWLRSHCTCPVCRAGVERVPSKTGEVVGLPVAGASSGPKEGSSSSSTSSSRIGVSLQRMLSGREWSGRRPARGDGVAEDVERC